MRGAGLARSERAITYKNNAQENTLHTSMSIVPGTRLEKPRRPSLRFEGRVEPAPLEIRKPFPPAPWPTADERRGR